MDKLRDLADKITGKDKYHHNLLGESLADLLRKATAKTLVTPDEAVNQQVVDTIQQEAAGGKDTKEIVSLLKKRLRTDNPQKQWLAVQLFGKVMTDCSNVLGMHQEELLQEVARVMARPAKPETEAGKAARHAAKELLRRFGRAGTTAFRAANQEVYGRPMAAMGPHGTAQGYPAGAIPYGYTAADYGQPGGRTDAGMNVERQSLAEEINLLIDKARSNTELLSDMLVNTTTNGKDEFEQELISDLLNEVIELRGLFMAYLEQLQAQEGADMEVLMVQALEATDTLDACIALHKDVSSDQQLPSPGAGGSNAPGYSGATLNYHLAPGGGAATAVPAAAPPPAAVQTNDLIALDDLADGLTSPALPSPAPVVHTSAYDPFAASNAVPLQPAAQPAPAPQMKSAFETMYAQPGAAAAAGVTGGASAYGAPAPAAQQQQPQQQGYAGGPFGSTTQYGAPTPGYGAPTPGYGAPTPAYGATPGYGAPQYGAPTPGYGAPYGVPSSFSGASAGSGYGVPAPQYGAPQYSHQQQPYGAAFGAAPQQQQQQQQHSQARPPAAAGNNPFAALPPSVSNDGMGFGMPMPPPGLMGPTITPPANPNNPFAAAASPRPAAASPAGAQPSAVDQEWDMFFADRNAGAPAGAGGPGHAQQIKADYDALVAKPTAAR